MTGGSEDGVNWGDHRRGDEGLQVNDARVVLAGGGEEKDGGDVNNGSLGREEGSGNRRLVFADAIVEEIGVHAKEIKDSGKSESAHALNTVGGSEKSAQDGLLHMQGRTEGERVDEGMVPGEKQEQVLAGVREGEEDSRNGREEDDRIEGLDGAVQVGEASAGGGGTVMDKVQKEVAAAIEERRKGDTAGGGEGAEREGIRQTSVGTLSEESAERAYAVQMTMDEAMQEIEMIEVQCVRTFAMIKVWCARTYIPCVCWR